MTRVQIREFAVEAIVVAFSGGFLAWYVAAKIAVWPWGASSF
jgi:cell division protein FtsX